MVIGAVVGGVVVFDATRSKRESARGAGRAFFCEGKWDPWDEWDR